MKLCKQPSVPLRKDLPDGGAGVEGIKPDGLIASHPPSGPEFWQQPIFPSSLPGGL